MNTLIFTKHPHTPMQMVEGYMDMDPDAYEDHFEDLMLFFTAKLYGDAPYALRWLSENELEQYNELRESFKRRAKRLAKMHCRPDAPNKTFIRKTAWALAVAVLGWDDLIRFRFNHGLLVPHQ